MEHGKRWLEVEDRDLKLCICELQQTGHGMGGQDKSRMEGLQQPEKGHERGMKVCRQCQ